MGALPEDTTIPTKVSDLTNDSGFLNATTLAPYLANKQDTLTAGTNITISNGVISASGGSSFSGDYDDLTNKPDLSVYAESADLATVATTGSYNDLSDKPTIPTVPTDVSDFTNDAGYITSADLPADELPTITTGDAGKVLAVNSNEDGVEWTTASGGGSATYTAGRGIEIDANNVIGLENTINPIFLTFLRSPTVAYPAAHTNGYIKFPQDKNGCISGLLDGYIIIPQVSDVNITQSDLNRTTNIYLVDFKAARTGGTFDISSVSGMGSVVLDISTFYYYDGATLYKWGNAGDIFNCLPIFYEGGLAKTLANKLKSLDTALTGKQDALPALTNNAGKVLTVNSGATGVEWATAASGGGLTIIKVSQMADWSNETDMKTFLLNYWNDPTIDICIAAMDTSDNNKLWYLTRIKKGSSIPYSTDVYWANPEASIIYKKGYHCMGGSVSWLGQSQSSTAELPTIASGDAAKVLAVNSGETGVVWRNVREVPTGNPMQNTGKFLQFTPLGGSWENIPTELPTIASGDAGKVLAVNSGETGVEWTTASSGASYTAGDGIVIDNDEISVDTSVVATKTDLSAKQNTLTAGTGISISNNVISATGGGGGGSADLSAFGLSEGSTVIEAAQTLSATNAIAGQGQFDVPEELTFTTVPQDGGEFIRRVPYITATMSFAGTDDTENSGVDFSEYDFNVSDIVLRPCHVNQYYVVYKNSDEGIYLSVTDNLGPDGNGNEWQINQIAMDGINGNDFNVDPWNEDTWELLGELTYSLVIPALKDYSPIYEKYLPDTVSYKAEVTDQISTTLSQYNLPVTNSRLEGIKHATGNNNNIVLQDNDNNSYFNSINIGDGEVTYRLEVVNGVFTSTKIYDAINPWFELQEIRWEISNCTYNNVDEDRYYYAVPLMGGVYEDDTSQVSISILNSNNEDDGNWQYSLDFRGNHIYPVVYFFVNAESTQDTYTITIDWNDANQQAQTKTITATFTTGTPSGSN